MSEIWPKSYETLINIAGKVTTNPRYVSEENHRKHVAINKKLNRVYHIKVDGNVIPKSCNTTKRIDFLLLNETKKTAYLIELKGSHLGDAVEQLEISHENLKDLLKGYSIRWRIVYHSRTTKTYTNKLQKKIRDYKTKYKLKYKESYMEENI